MHQGLRVSRRWLALTLILFGLPLFVGLRSLDLETDEAIYSFAVDKILEDGDWLRPKSSPSETVAFLEKPPLKFWIVALPIKLGLLPDDEFGMRFWDALFGAIAFAYVFAIGSRMAGPVCGGVAVLVLFVHWRLIFEHGLRTNNMEGALFLAYCGGIWHFLEWARSPAANTRPARHALAVGLYFALGFMTKFVAVVFLPATIGLAALMFADTRRRLWTERRSWLVAAAWALVVIVPWFVFAQIEFGSLVWQTMLAEHVYARFTVALNPEHVQPWDWYFTSMRDVFLGNGILWLVPVGVTVLVVQSIRRRWLEGVTVLLWAAVPLAAISLGSSKLYHYAYPFLPPLAIATGYLFGLVVMLAPVVLRRMAEAVEDGLALRAPRWATAVEAPWVKRVAAVLIWVGAGLAIWALLVGQARVEVAGRILFKSGGITRPLALILLTGLLARRSGRVALLAVAIAAAYWLPIDAYKQTMVRLTEPKHPLRNLSDCILRTQRATPTLASGLYVDTDSSMWHPIVFYFRRVAPWIRQESPSVERLIEMTSGPQLRASLVQDRRYRDYLNAPAANLLRDGGTPPMVGLFEYALVLPGPYRACSPEAALVAP